MSPDRSWRAYVNQLVDTSELDDSTMLTAVCLWLDEREVENPGITIPLSAFLAEGFGVTPVLPTQPEAVQGAPSPGAG